MILHNGSFLEIYFYCLMLNVYCLMPDVEYLNSEGASMMLSQNQNQLFLYGYLLPLG